MTTSDIIVTWRDDSRAYDNIIMTLACLAYNVEQILGDALGKLVVALAIVELVECSILLLVGHLKPHL